MQYVYNMLVVMLVFGFVSHCNGIESYGLTFQENGYMNDDSDNVWAKLVTPLPELTTFSICTWVKFTYEVEHFLVFCMPAGCITFSFSFCRESTINFGLIVICCHLALKDHFLFAAHSHLSQECSHNR